MPAGQAAEADRLRLRTPDPGRVRNPRERRLAIAMGGFALVGATATMSVVAQSALPGDLLYPLKRGIESVHAGISVGDEGKGTTLLASASTRLDEVSRLDAGEHEAEIADTLDDFTQQAIEASDLLLASYAEKRRRHDRHRAADPSPPRRWSRCPTSTARCRPPLRTSTSTR